MKWYSIGIRTALFTHISHELETYQNDENLISVAFPIVISHNHNLLYHYIQYCTYEQMNSQHIYIIIPENVKVTLHWQTRNSFQSDMIESVKMNEPKNQHERQYNTYRFSL